MNGDGLRAFLAFLQRLERAKISYLLRHCREDALMAQVDVPGERWEVELVDYGDEFQWEIERFSPGRIEDESALEELFSRFSDEEPAASHDTARK